MEIEGERRLARRKSRRNEVIVERFPLSTHKDIMYVWDVV